MIPIGLLALLAFSPSPLSQQEACKLAGQERIPASKTYAIAGTYQADGMHGSFMELPTCDAALFPIMTGEAEAQIAAYHQAFQRQCGGPLMGDRIEGVFTGRFSARKAQLYGMRSPTMVNFFIVEAIDTKALDPASITCGH